jgi:uncharacterized sulfatase
MVMTFVGMLGATSARAAEQPNILWITTEDIGPHLGCYGDTYAQTPNLDALAARGILYRNVWSNAPVCAPARTAIITGVSPTSLGAEHMRSEVPCPPFMRMYPQFLRRAGYYCTNNDKEDYNFANLGQVWDESSKKAHWRNRKPGQPFFAVFNILVTHESQIRKRPHEWKHDPSKARIPARQPDTLEVRQDWAQYYDQITETDGIVAARLRELDEAGVADSTIVFFYGDNGPGMPGYKRSTRDSGLRVPLIVYVPPKFAQLAPQASMAGGKSDRLVSFIDLAPTVLELAGVQPPDWMQGRAFMGPTPAADPTFIYGFRGRMDERYDLVRCMRDQRYVYVRNYMPHLPEGQHLTYMFETPSTQAWKKLFDEGKLTPPQSLFWERRQPEELYDLQSDPDETRNLAGSPEHQERLTRMRQALRDHLLAARDVGFLPEGEIHSRSQGSSPYEMARDESKYPLERILVMAELASSLDDAAVPRLQTALTQDSDSAVRYWAAMGILMRGHSAVADAQAALETALRDASPYVRIVSAEALAQFAPDRKPDDAIASLLEAADASRHGIYVAAFALNAIDELGPPAASVRTAVARLPRSCPSAPDNMKTCLPRLIDKITGEPR